VGYGRYGVRSDAADANVALRGELVEAARDYARASHAKRTRDAYARAWQSFAAWCAERQLRALPAAPAVGRASTQSLFRRFFAVKSSFTEHEIAFFLNVDFIKHVALVAVVEEGGSSKVTVPALLIGAEWDQDAPPYMGQTLFPWLVNSPSKRYVELAEGTHTIIMEKNRLKLFEAVQAFLDESPGS
jgi:pimeloyl-ACP methyl ester carboxylesterase